jgi:aldehyde:ferredoxin oxidoreductase
MRGVWGKSKRIDLRDGRIYDERIPADVFAAFLGGKGLAAWALARAVDPRCDPTGPGNALVIAAGPLQASALPSTGRCAMATKSPLTGIYLDSFVGGEFGNAFKRAGQDAAIITGRCAGPSVLVFDDSGARVEPTASLWGLGTKECTRRLKASHPGASVLAIGPAGEKHVRFACAIADERRAIGRGGIGAVMGSKNIKAIVAYGTRVPEAHDGERVREVARAIHERMRKARRKGSSFYKFGTMTAVEYANFAGRFPVRNFQSGRLEGYEALAAETVHERYEVKNTSCAVCGIACEGHLRDPDGDPGNVGPAPKAGAEPADVAKVADVRIPGAGAAATSGVVVERPEYEAVAMLGGNLGIRDYETIVRANALCNDFGLDVISTGNLAGFIMECSQCGCGPGGLRFGDGGALLDFIRALGEEPGRLGEMVKGVRELARAWGKGVERFAMHVKGLELPAWDPRGKLGAGLAYMTADIGGSHLRDHYHTKRVPDISAAEVVGDIIDSQNEMALIDSGILCLFSKEPSRDLLLEAIQAQTGLRLSEEEAIRIGERTWNLARLFNVANGISRRDDRLPSRWMTEPMDVGPAKGCRAFVSEEDAENSLSLYYSTRGWDHSGRPEETKLEALGLISEARTLGVGVGLTAAL